LFLTKKKEDPNETHGDASEKVCESLVGGGGG